MHTVEDRIVEALFVATRQAASVTVSTRALTHDSMKGFRSLLQEQTFIACGFTKESRTGVDVSMGDVMIEIKGMKELLDFRTDQKRGYRKTRDIIVYNKRGNTEIDYVPKSDITCLIDNQTGRCAVVPSDKIIINTTSNPKAKITGHFSEKDVVFVDDGSGVKPILALQILSKALAEDDFVKFFINCDDNIDDEKITDYSDGIRLLFSYLMDLPKNVYQNTDSLSRR